MMKAMVFKRAGRNPGRALAAGLLGLSIAGSTIAPAVARQPGAVCRVHFTGISTVRYSTDLTLTGFIIKGSHNYTPDARAGGSTSTDFEVLDTDGYMTLQILMTEWQASGKLERNRTEAVSYPRSDIVLALDAAAAGLTYQHAVATRLAGQRPANANDVLRLLALKTEGMKMLQEGLRSALENSRGGSVDLPPGFLSVRLGWVLDGLQQGDGQLIMAQYMDRPYPDVQNVLCQPDARSVIVGQVLCGTRFVDGTPREPAICPDGIELNQLSSLPRCRRVGGEDIC